MQIPRSECDHYFVLFFPCTESVFRDCDKYRTLNHFFVGRIDRTENVSSWPSFNTQLNSTL